MYRNYRCCGRTYRLHLQGRKLWLKEEKEAGHRSLKNNYVKSHFTLDIPLGFMVYKLACNCRRQPVYYYYCYICRVYGNMFRPTFWTYSGLYITQNQSQLRAKLTC
jgi:hypothetical protein